MKLTTRGRYAVTAMLDLALCAQERPMTLADVARRQEISLSYLEQLFSRLRKRSLVTSVRGPGGGYRLGREPDQITVAEVILAVNENIDATACGGTHNCQGRDTCLTHELWHDLSQRIASRLQEITLGALVERNNAAEPRKRRCRKTASVSSNRAHGTANGTG